jgi:hypothetical protein
MFIPWKGNHVTIAISLKVNDGLVLAADSASTLIGQDEKGNQVVVNVYNNANKVFNLRKGLPIGAITWGSGSIGTASISTLMKDFRRRLTGEDKTHKEWKISTNYTVEQVAQKLRGYLFDELYVPAFKDWKAKPDLGVIVAGYSSGQSMAEEYQIDIHNGECRGPRSIRDKSESGITWGGEPEAINRLVLGFGLGLANVLQENLSVPKDQIGPAMQVIQQALTVPLVWAPMPIQDAIDLTEFLVDLTIKFSRFTPGASTVGGPIEIAAITKHEGFKWARRKHYYSREMNLEDDDAKTR